MGSRKRHRGRYSVSLVALATALFFIPGVPAAVGAETHEVACPSDSLQDAIDAAAPRDTIVFSGTCMENVVVNTTLSLLGSGTATIDGGGVGTVIEFKAAADAHLESFSVVNGAAPHGAGIRIHVGASVDGSYLVIRDNSASIGGGAVFNEGDLDLEHSIVTDNVTATTEWGDVLLAAGIANSGVVSLHDVEFSGNSGDYVGAIGNSDTGTLTITASHFHDQGSYYEYEPGWWVIDSAGEIGGAIANRGIATVSDTFFERNHAWSSGGAIHNVGDLTVERSSFVENRTDDAGGGSGGGAGIYSFGQARITDADFIGNIAWEDPGAGVMNYGVMEIARSTFTNNLSEWPGAAIANGKEWGAVEPSLTISDSQFSGNTSWYGAVLSSFGVLDAIGLNFDDNPDAAFETWGSASVSNSTFANSAGPGVVVLGGTLDAAELTIYGNDESGVMLASEFEGPGPVAWIESSIIEGNGGGILVADGELTLADSWLSGNAAPQGGGIRVAPLGTAALRNVYGSSNRGVQGGVAYVDGGHLEIVESQFDHNYADQSGGGIAIVGGGHVSLIDSTLNDHYAGWNGGAVHVDGSTIDIVGSILNANNAESGAAMACIRGSTATVTGTFMSYNIAHQYGGAVLNVASQLTLDSSSVTQNQAVLNGGGVSSRYGSGGPASFTAANSTIASNFAEYGSGIENLNGLVVLDSVTLTDNGRGSAFYERTWARNAIVTNSIVAGNRAGDCDVNQVTSGGGNVFGPGCTLAAGQPTDALDVADPLLEFDGNVAVIDWATPLAGSPSIDRIPVAACTQPVDQAGTTRPIGAGCDSGSIEAEATGPDIVPPVVDADFTHGDTFPSGVVHFTGSATDNVGVEWVGVAVQRLDTKQWLQDDEVSWGNFNRFEAVLSDPGGVATDWSWSVALPDNRYVFSALAKDAAGNEGRIVPWRLFIVGGDTTPPTVDAAFAHNAELPSGSALTGTATDDVGVTWVGIGVQRLDTKQWLQDDRVSWGNFNRLPAVLSDPGGVATDWRLVVDLPLGHYVLSARAKDAAGNSGYIVPWRGFYIV